MVKWCLYLRHQSRSVYKTLRSSGCLSLPSQRTLRDYTHYTSTTIWFSDEVDKQLIATADMPDLQEYQKAVGVVLDEMHIRERLVYDEHSGALAGFTDLGDVNNILSDFDRSLSEETQTPQLSKKCLFSWCEAYLPSFNILIPNLLLQRYLVIKFSPFSGNAL